MNVVYLSDGKLNRPFLLKNANLLCRGGEYRLARNIYRALFLAGESQAAMLYRLGQCFEAEGRWKEALQSYQEVVKY